MYIYNVALVFDFKSNQKEHMTVYYLSEKDNVNFYSSNPSILVELVEIDTISDSLAKALEDSTITITTDNFDINGANK